ncbi:MAG: septum formation initiator family protein [Deferribacterales bacterium]
MKAGLIYFALIAGLVLYLFFGHNGVLKYRELVGLKNTYEAQIMEMDSKIRSLQKELEAIKKDKEYLELLIRKELNMRSPDEDIYIIGNEKIHSNGDNRSN